MFRTVILSILLGGVFNLQGLNASDLRERFISELKQVMTRKVIQEIPEFNPENIDIKIKNKSITQEIPESAISWQIEEDRQRVVVGDIAVNITFLNKKKEVIETKKCAMLVDGKVTLFQLAKTMKKKRILKEQDLIPKTAPLSQISTRLLLNKEDIIGKELRHDLRQKTVIKPYHIRSVPMIHRGDMIAIMIKKPHFEVSVKGEALEDGEKGDMIRVRTWLNQKKIMKGHIADETMVTIPLHY